MQASKALSLDLEPSITPEWSWISRLPRFGTYSCTSVWSILSVKACAAPSPELVSELANNASANIDVKSSDGDGDGDCWFSYVLIVRSPILFL